MIISPRHPQNNWKEETKPSVELRSLRPIAQRQINSLLRRLTITGKYQLYREEIDKVISHENEVNNSKSNK